MRTNLDIEYCVDILIGLVVMQGVPYWLAFQVLQSLISTSISPLQEKAICQAYDSKLEQGVTVH